SCAASDTAFTQRVAARDALTAANPKTQQLLDAANAADRAYDSARAKCDSAAADVRRNTRAGLQAESDWNDANAAYSKCCADHKPREVPCRPECQDALD